MKRANESPIDPVTEKLISLVKKTVPNKVGNDKKDAFSQHVCEELEILRIWCRSGAHGQMPLPESGILHEFLRSDWSVSDTYPGDLKKAWRDFRNAEGAEAFLVVFRAFIVVSQQMDQARAFSGQMNTATREGFSKLCKFMLCDAWPYLASDEVLLNSVRAYAPCADDLFWIAGNVGRIRSLVLKYLPPADPQGTQTEDDVRSAVVRVARYLELNSTSFLCQFRGGASRNPRVTDENQNDATSRKIADRFVSSLSAAPLSWTALPDAKLSPLLIFGNASVLDARGGSRIGTLLSFDERDQELGTASPDATTKPSLEAPSLYRARLLWPTSLAMSLEFAPVASIALIGRMDDIWSSVRDAEVDRNAEIKNRPLYLAKPNPRTLSAGKPQNISADAPKYIALLPARLPFRMREKPTAAAAAALKYTDHMRRGILADRLLHAAEHKRAQRKLVASLRPKGRKAIVKSLAVSLSRLLRQYALTHVGCHGLHEALARARTRGVRNQCRLTTFVLAHLLKDDEATDVAYATSQIVSGLAHLADGTALGEELISLLAEVVDRRNGGREVWAGAYFATLPETRRRKTTLAIITKAAWCLSRYTGDVRSAERRRTPVTPIPQEVVDVCLAGLGDLEPRESRDIVLSLEGIRVSGAQLIGTFHGAGFPAVTALGGTALNLAMSLELYEDIFEAARNIAFSFSAETIFNESRKREAAVLAPKSTSTVINAPIDTQTRGSMVCSLRLWLRAPKNRRLTENDVKTALLRTRFCGGLVESVRSVRSIVVNNADLNDRNAARREALRAVVRAIGQAGGYVVSSTPSRGVGIEHAGPCVLRQGSELIANQDHYRISQPVSFGSGALGQAAAFLLTLPAPPRTGKAASVGNQGASVAGGPDSGSRAQPAKAIDPARWTKGYGFLSSYGFRVVSEAPGVTPARVGRNGEIVAERVVFAESLMALTYLRNARVAFSVNKGDDKEADGKIAKLLGDVFFTYCDVNRANEKIDDAGVYVIYASRETLFAEAFDVPDDKVSLSVQGWGGIM